MSKLLDQATEKLTSDLEDGERAIAATKAHLDGGMVGVGIRLAAAGTVLGADELSNGAVLVATDRRLLIMSATAATFKPDKLVLAIPYGELSKVETGTKRVMMVKVPTIGLHHREGPEAWFESPKVEGKNVAEVVEAVRAGIGS